LIGANVAVKTSRGVPVVLLVGEGEVEGEADAVGDAEGELLADGEADGDGDGLA